MIGVALLRLIRGEVRLGDDAAVAPPCPRRCDRRSSPCRTRPARRSRSPCRLFARSGQHEPIARGPRAAARLAVRGDRRGERLHAARPLRSSSPRASDADITKPFAASIGGRHDDVLPRQLAEALVRERHAAHRARHARRQIARRGQRASIFPSAPEVHRRRGLARARSRDSRTSWPRRRAVRTTMNPPPPMLPANGCVTASAKAVATAASTALPPAASTPAPRSDAMSDDETTSPVRLPTPSSLGTGCENKPDGATATMSEGEDELAHGRIPRKLTPPASPSVSMRTNWAYWAIGS